MLCGDVAPLALDTNEEADIGASLATCLQTLPQPIGDTIGLLGPWSKLASSLGGAILKRVAMVAAARRANKTAAAQVQGPRAAAATVPNAPVPNGQTSPQPPGPWDVVSPTPVQL